MIDDDSSVAPDGAIRCPSRKAPPPAQAENLTPTAWLTTTAATGPSSDTAHRLVAHHGRPRDALVEPSTGSITTRMGRSGWWSPDSSEKAPRPARSSPSRAAASATISLPYWSGRV